MASGVSGDPTASRESVIARYDYEAERPYTLLVLRLHWARLYAVRLQSGGWNAQTFTYTPFLEEAMACYMKEMASAGANVRDSG